MRLRYVVAHLPENNQLADGYEDADHDTPNQWRWIAHKADEVAP